MPLAPDCPRNPRFSRGRSRTGPLPPAAWATMASGTGAGDGSATTSVSASLPLDPFEIPSGFCLLGRRRRLPPRRVANSARERPVVILASEFPRDSSDSAASGEAFDRFFVAPRLVGDFFWLAFVVTARFVAVRFFFGSPSTLAADFLPRRFAGAGSAAS